MQKSIIEQCKFYHTNMITFLKELLPINSYTFNKEEVNRLVNILEDKINSLGFTVTVDIV